MVDEVTQTDKNKSDCNPAIDNAWKFENLVQAIVLAAVNKGNRLDPSYTKDLVDSARSIAYELGWLTKPLPPELQVVAEALEESTPTGEREGVE